MEPGYRDALAARTDANTVGSEDLRGYHGGTVGYQPASSPDQSSAGVPS